MPFILMNSYFPKIGSELRYADARRGSAAHIPRSSLRARCSALGIFLSVCPLYIDWLALCRAVRRERAKHQQIYASLVNGEAEHQLRHRSTAQKQSTPVRHNQSLSLLAVWRGHGESSRDSLSCNASYELTGTSLLYRRWSLMLFRSEEPFLGRPRECRTEIVDLFWRQVSDLLPT